MVNSEQFANRLQKILEFYDISAANFAEAIDVGRSSISHILSGRNKPSLDFVMKVVQTFPEVELYWLLNGKGNFPPRANENKENKTQNPSEATESIPVDTRRDEILENSADRFPDNSKKIKRIVLLYEDGSFEAFEN